MSNQPSVSQGANDQTRYIPTGIHGLDVILKGGFLAGGFYLLQGDPGSGKTTFGLQYLLNRAKEREVTLYITLTESRRDLEKICDSHGWKFDQYNLRLARP
jgi:circadian clock protein KaiC